MPKEDCGDAVPGYLGSAYLLALGLGVRHTRPHTLPYHRQLQLAEYTSHLKEREAHPIRETGEDVLPFCT